MRMGQSCWSTSGQLRFSACSNNLKRKAALGGKKNQSEMELWLLVYPIAYW